MEKKIIAPLEKNRLNKPGTEKEAKAGGCCGGTPAANTDACCKLDEDKKAEGEDGCGCQAATGNNQQQSSCC